MILCPHLCENHFRKLNITFQMRNDQCSVDGKDHQLFFLEVNYISAINVHLKVNLHYFIWFLSVEQRPNVTYFRKSDFN